MDSAERVEAEGQWGGEAEWEEAGEEGRGASYVLVRQKGGVVIEPRKE